MKSKLLPFSLLAFILGFTTIIVASGWITGIKGPKQTSDEYAGIRAANDYLNKLRQNQVTGKIDPNDVLKARNQAEQMRFKAGNELGLNWEEMGPDNIPGRIRAVIFDITDPSGQTIITAGITGGLWKTTNLGSTWEKINKANQNLYVSCLVQASNGTIYAGTGESFCTTEDTYYGGLIGQGIYKSTDSDNFSIVDETQPAVSQIPDTVDWAYVNNLCIDPSSQRLYAATNTGLWYSNDGINGWQKVSKYYYDTVYYDVNLSIDSVVHCDSYEVNGDIIIINNPTFLAPDTTNYSKQVNNTVRNILDLGKKRCSDVEVASDGMVAATFDNLIMTAPGGNDLTFTNRSRNPKNPMEMSREQRYYSTTLTLIDTLGNTYARPVIQFTTTSEWGFTTSTLSSPLSDNPGRAEIAISPSDPNIVYVVSTGQFGYLHNIYLSEDKGNSWEVILPGGSSLEIFNGSGCFNNTITVFPEDPYKILVGGRDMWYGKKYASGGYFDWGSGPVSSSQYAETSPNYLPLGHHRYVFQPGSSSKMVIATNKGLSLGTFSSYGIEFLRINRLLSITQCYTVGISGYRHEFLTGAQGNGTLYVSGNGNTAEYAEQIYGGNGGSCAISLINPNAFIYSQGAGVIVRSEDKGENTSFNFTPPGSNIFITPFILWENFNDPNSRDSLMFYADKDYLAGDIAIARSENYDYPFNYLMENDLLKGDSIKIQDVVQSKFLLAIANAVYVTKDVIKFDKEPDFWKIANTPGFPTTIAASKDANFVFVGTDNGKLYRISNVALAYDSLRADIGSSACIIATNELQVPEFTDRHITSVSVDQQNPEHVIVTLANYGNESYIFRTTNSLDSASVVTFTDVTGNLPKMPVYSGIIEKSNSNVAIIGTEYGIYTTNNLGDGENVVWTPELSGLGIIPVFQIKQQTVYKPSFTVYNPNPSIPPLYYPEVQNFGDIYIATFGRGVYRDETYRTVGIENPVKNRISLQNSVKIYPNPVMDYSTISFNLQTSGNVNLKVYDLNGKIVFTQTFQQMSQGKHDIPLDCSELVTGTYIVKIAAGNQSGSSKFIVR